MTPRERASADRPSVGAAPVASAETPASPGTLTLAGKVVGVEATPPADGSGARLVVRVTAPDRAAVELSFTSDLTVCDTSAAALSPVVNAARIGLVQLFCENGEDEFSRALLALVLDVGDAAHAPRVLWQGKGSYSSSFDACERIDVPEVRVTGPSSLDVIRYTEVVVHAGSAAPGRACSAEPAARRPLASLTY